MRKLKNNNGEGYIETVIIVFVSVMAIVLLLNVFSLVIEEQKLSYFSRELLISASANGGMVDKTMERYDKLCEEVGFIPTLDSSLSNFINSNNGKVQLGETITITLTHVFNLEGFGIMNIPITITRTGSGISERYWK